MKVSEDEKKNQIAISLIEGVGVKIGKKLLVYLIIESLDWEF